jgi:hypothetical protein
MEDNEKQECPETGNLPVARLIRFPEKYNRSAILLGTPVNEDHEGDDDMVPAAACTTLRVPETDMLSDLFATTEPLEITIILDLSYSMSNVLDGYQDGILKKILCKALVLIHQRLPGVRIALWGFSNCCFEIQLPSNLGDYDALCKALKLKPLASTNFSAVHVQLQQLMKSTPGKKRRILMFTDGCDTSSAPKAVVADNLKTTKNFAKEYCQECKFIVLGFTAAHDAAHLTTLAAPDGNFYYVKDQSSLEPTLAKISEELMAVAIPLVNVHTYNGLIKRFTPQLLDHSSLLIFVRPHLEEGQRPCRLSIGANTSEEGECSTEFEIVNGNLEDLSTEVWISLMIALLRYETVSLTKDLAEHHNVAFAETVAEKLDDYQKDLDTIYEKTQPLDIITRKERRTEIMALRQTIGNMRSTLAQIAKDGLSDDRLATISSYAFQGFQSSVRKTMDKRAMANQKRIQQIPKECHRIVQSMDIPALKEKYEAVLEDSGLKSCVLTTDDIWEALEDGGHTLLLGFQMARGRQTTVQEPTLANVKSVSTTFFRSDAAQDAIEHRLSQDASAHGGFLDKQYSAQVRVVRHNSGDYICVGESREPINAWLPLDPFARYAPEDREAGKYWSLAKKRAVPVLGWMFTTDPLGFSFKQLQAVPFLVLRKLIETTSLSTLNFHAPRETETFHERIAGMVLGTCIRAWREYPKAEKDFILDLLRKNTYIDNRASRLRDSVVSNSLLALQWYVASVVGDLDLAQYDMDLVLSFMVEEEIRRWTEKRTVQMNIRKAAADADDNVARWKDIVNLFNIKEEEWTGAAPTDSWLRQQTLHYVSEFLGVDPATLQDQVDFGTDRASDTLEDTAARRDFFQALQTFSGHVLETLRPSLQLVHPAAENWLHLGHVPNWKRPFYQWAMVLQNQNYNSNKAFREGLDKNEIVNFVGAPTETVEQWLRDLSCQTIEKLKKSVPSNLNPYGIFKCPEVYVFCNTTDLRAAAAVLAKHPGGGNWGIYIAPFRKRKDIPHYAQKIQMLTSGEYEGQKFRTPSGKFAPWVPSKRNAAIFKYSMADIEAAAAAS